MKNLVITICILFLCLNSVCAQTEDNSDSITNEFKKNSIYIEDYVIFLPALCYDRSFQLSQTIGIVLKAGAGLNILWGGTFLVTEGIILFGRKKHFMEIGAGTFIGYEEVGFGKIGYRYCAARGFLFKGVLSYFPQDDVGIVMPSVGLGYSF